MDFQHLANKIHCHDFRTPSPLELRSKYYEQRQSSRRQRGEVVSLQPCKRLDWVIDISFIPFGGDTRIPRLRVTSGASASITYNYNQPETRLS
jgi:hypothetical protein